MFKKCLVIGLLLSAYSAYGDEYSVKLGIEPYRKTSITDNGVSQNSDGSLGFSIGGEYLWINKDTKYGLGAELRTQTSHYKNFFGNELNFYSNPLYGVVKQSFMDNKFYGIGKLGVGFNSGDALVNEITPYFALGIGKSFGSIDLELTGETTKIKEDSSFNVVSFKVAYVLNREKKIEIVFEKPILEFEEKTYINTDTIPNLVVNGNDTITDKSFNYKLESTKDSNITIIENVTKTENIYQIPKSLNDGNYKISVEVTKGDKKSELQEKNFSIDTIGPEIESTATAKDNKVLSTWNIKDIDAKDVVVIFNNQVISKEIKGSFENKENLKTGTYKLIVKASDKYGNISIVEKSVVVVNNVDEKERKEIEDFSNGKSSLPLISGYKINITALTPKQEQRAKDAIDVLDGLKGTLSVVAYTDDTGTEEYNAKISTERATIIAEKIMKFIKNSDEIKIKIVGKGETKFKVDNTSEENRELNRRIEFEFVGEKGKSIQTLDFTK